MDGYRVGIQRLVEGAPKYSPPLDWSKANV